MQSRLLQNAFFIGLLLVTTLAFLGLIWNFLLALFWAAVLATLFYPLRERLTHTLGGRPSPAAALAVLVVVLVVVLPLLGVGLAVGRESVQLYERLQSGEIDVQALVERFEELLPVATGYLDRWGVETERLQQNLSGAAVSVSQFVAGRAVALGQGALQFVVQLFVMLYVLFFFLRDGEGLVDALIRALPLGDVRERRLLSRFAEVSRATLKGTLVVGFVQGALGGLLFWMLGIGAPVFWGAVMTVLSLLPAVGAAIVWVPAAVILLVQGAVARGLVLVAGGILLVGLADNVLRPLLVGRDTRMPDFLILISTLGGLAVFGLSGVVIGPLIAAFFLTVWQMFEEEFGGTDQDPEPVKEAAVASHEEKPADEQPRVPPEERGEEEEPASSTPSPPEAAPDASA